MQSMIKKFGAAAAVSVLASFATAPIASASTVNVSYQGSGPFGSPNYSKVAYIASSDYTGGTRAGPFRLTGDNGMGDFVAFCVDLAKYLGNGQSYTTASNSAFGSAVDTNIDKLFTSSYAGINSRVEGAAFQLALWEIITDTASGFDLSSGGFRVSWAPAAVVSQAASYLSGLASAATGGYQLTFLNSGSSQNLVTVSQISPVPLPAAAGMLGFGVLTLVGVRRRKRN